MLVKGATEGKLRYMSALWPGPCMSLKNATVWPCCILVQKTRKYLMRKICRLHVLILIQPDQYQARPIRGQDLGGVPAPGIIGVTRPVFFAEARRVFCLCCTSPFVGYSPRFLLSPTITQRIFSRWVIGPHYDVSETWPSRLHRRPQFRTTLARRRRRGT